MLQVQSGSWWFKACDLSMSSASLLSRGNKVQCNRTGLWETFIKYYVSKLFKFGLTDLGKLVRIMEEKSLYVGIYYLKQVKKVCIDFGH